MWTAASSFLQMGLVLGLLSTTNGVSKRPDHRLLLVSLDGFRWDYLNGRAHTPNFDAMKRAGVHATRGLKNEFVTNTFPNHYSLVTGLHAESHGVVDNFMYDPHTEDNFVPAFHDPDFVNQPEWHDDLGGTPIWVSNQKNQGFSGVIMWMGGEAVIQGTRPSRHIAFNVHDSEIQRVDTLVTWFSDTNDPINLGILYINQPDFLAHTVGPDSDLISKKIEELDGIVGHLFKKLDEKGLLTSTDIIITSDHGFVSVSKEKVISLDSIIDSSWYKQSSAIPGPMASIFPVKDKEDAIYHKLEAASRSNGHFTVYKRKDIPERFHYKNHRRIPDIIAMADPGYSFVNKSPDELVYKGNHGFDNQLQHMHPFFIAQGPSFKEDFAVDQFATVDVYPLMCHIMKLTPAPNNGSLDIVGHLLRETPSEGLQHQQFLSIVQFLIAVLGLAVLSKIFTLPRKKKD